MGIKDFKDFKLEAFQCKSIQGGDTCTGGEVQQVGYQENFLDTHGRLVYRARDGDSVSADGTVSYTNLRTEYGSWEYVQTFPGGVWRR